MKRSPRRAVWRLPGPGYDFSSARAGVAHLVERDLAKVEVAGSKPVSRSIQTPRFAFETGALKCTKTRSYSGQISDQTRTRECLRVITASGPARKRPSSGRSAGTTPSLTAGRESRGRRPDRTQVTAPPCRATRGGYLQTPRSP